jgi:hypothetical protein
MNKESVLNKWKPIITSRIIFESSVQLPKEMIDYLCYYAEYSSTLELSQINYMNPTGPIISGIGDNSKISDLLKSVIDNYIKDNSKKLEVKKILYDTSLNNICFELSDGTTRYLGGEPTINNIYDIYKYFPENFISHIDPQFRRNLQIDKIV